MLSLLNLPFLIQKVLFPREKMRSSMLVVLTVSDDITPMKDEPEMNVGLNFP